MGTRAVGDPAWLQGVSPGQLELAAGPDAGRVRVTVDVRGIDLRDGDGEVVDMTHSHASLERTPPSRIEGPSDARYDDPDALRVVLALPDDGPGLDGDRDIAVDSVSALGAPVDSLPRLALAPSPCARPYVAMRCWASAPLRLVIDDVDRDHPLVNDRSIKAELGGAIAVRLDGRKAQMIRVLGPRASPVGPIGRYRASLRPFVVRVSPGGAPAIGGTDAGAVSALRAELVVGSRHLEPVRRGLRRPARALEVQVVVPPPSHLVAIGDDLGIPASGGEIHIRLGDRPVVVPTVAGQGPDRVARNVARAAERAGFVAVVSPNARIGPGIAPSVDVSIRRRDGKLVAVDAVPGQPLSSDSTLSVRIGSVDLSDGLQHFTDMDATAGTIEERTLLKAIDDGDPTTIEVVVVPLFAGGGPHVGESVHRQRACQPSADCRHSSIAPASAREERSLTLAHELGHALMDNFPATPTTSAPLPRRSSWTPASPTRPRSARAASPSTSAPASFGKSGPQARVPLLAVAHRPRALQQRRRTPYCALMTVRAAVRLA